MYSKLSASTPTLKPLPRNLPLNPPTSPNLGLNSPHSPLRTSALSKSPSTSHHSSKPRIPVQSPETATQKPSSAMTGLRTPWSAQPPKASSKTVLSSPLTTHLFHTLPSATKSPLLARLLLSKHATLSTWTSNTDRLRKVSKELLVTIPGTNSVKATDQEKSKGAAVNGGCVPIAAEISLGIRSILGRGKYKAREGLRVIWERKLRPVCSSAKSGSGASCLRIIADGTGEVVLDLQNKELDKFLDASLSKMGYQKFENRAFTIEFVEGDFITFEIDQLIPKTTVFYNQIYTDLLPETQVIAQDAYFCRSTNEEDRFLFYLWQLQMKELRMESTIAAGLKSPTTILSKNMIPQDGIRWNLTMVRSFWRDYFEKVEKLFKLLNDMLGEWYSNEKNPKIFYSSAQKLMHLFSKLRERILLIVEYLVNPVLEASQPFVRSSKVEADLVHVRGQKYPSHSGGLFATEDLFGQRVDAAIGTMKKFKSWIEPLAEFETKKDLQAIWKWQTQFPIETLLSDHLHQGLIGLWDKSKVVGQTIISSYAEFLTQQLRKVDPKPFIRKECNHMSLKMIPTTIPSLALSQANRDFIQSCHTYNFGAKPNEESLSYELIYRLGKSPAWQKLIPQEAWPHNYQSLSFHFFVGDYICMLSPGYLSFCRLNNSTNPSQGATSRDSILPASQYHNYPLPESWQSLRANGGNPVAFSRAFDADSCTVVECICSQPLVLMLTRVVPLHAHSHNQYPEYKFSQLHTIAPEPDWDYFTPGIPFVCEFAFGRTDLFGIVGFDPERYFYLVKYRVAPTLALKDEHKYVLEVPQFSAREDPNNVVATKLSIDGLRKSDGVIVVRKVLGRSSELLKVRPCIKFLLAKVKLEHGRYTDSGLMANEFVEFADFLNLHSAKSKQSLESKPRVVELKSQVFVLDTSLLYTPLLFCIHKRRFVRVQNRNLKLPNPDSQFLTHARFQVTTSHQFLQFTPSHSESAHFPNPFELMDMSGASVQLVQPTSYPVLFSKRAKFLSTPYTEHKLYKLTIKY